MCACVYMHQDLGAPNGVDVWSCRCMLETRVIGINLPRRLPANVDKTVVVRHSRPRLSVEQLQRLPILRVRIMRVTHEFLPW